MMLLLLFLPCPWLPFQLKNIITFAQHQLITLGERGACLSDLPRVVHDHRMAVEERASYGLQV